MAGLDEPVPSQKLAERQAVLRQDAPPEMRPSCYMQSSRLSGRLMKCKAATRQADSCRAALLPVRQAHEGRSSCPGCQVGLSPIRQLHVGRSIGDDAGRPADDAGRPAGAGKTGCAGSCPLWQRGTGRFWDLLGLLELLGPCLWDGLWVMRTE